MAEYIVESSYLAKGKLHQTLTRMKWLRLYTADVTPDRSLDPRDASYVQPTGTGYVERDISGHSLPDPNDYPVDGNYTAYRDIPTQEFVITADGTEEHVYGFVICEDDGAIIAAQRGDGPFFPLPFYRAGDRIRVTLRLTQESYGPPPPPAP